MGYLRLRGIIPDALTAFNEDYSLDEAGWVTMLRRYNEIPEVEMVAILGGNGEGFTLTMPEFRRAVRVAVENLQPRLIVIPNIYAESYHKMLEKVEAAHEADLVALGLGGARAQLPEVAAVHGEDQIEVSEVRGPHGTRDGIHGHAMAFRHPPRARVGPVPFVEVLGPRRVQLEAITEPRGPGEIAEERLGQRRATDVPGADEEEASRLRRGQWVRHRARE